MDDTLRVLVITGPTGVGKTEASVLVAEDLGGEIVSADSRQVYRGVAVGTAAPTPEQRARIPHHLIGAHDPRIAWSAGSFAAEAATCIQGILGRGRVPIVVGGSGFYLRALTEGLFEEPESNPDRQAHVRAELERRLRAEGLAALYAELRTKDPERAASVGAGDTQRVLRGLEYLMLTGEPLGHALAIRSPRPPIQADWVIALLERERRDLYLRIDARVEELLAEGWLEEARSLRMAGLAPGAPGLSGLGYDHLFGHLDGRVSLDDALAAIRRDHRHYAKRQMTWFRGLEGAHRVPLGPADGAPEAARRIGAIWDG